MDLIDMQKEYLEKGELVNRQVVDTDKEYEFLDGLIEWDIRARPRFKLGNYTFDFKIIGYPILIEIDGGVHNKEEVKKRDYKKDRFALINGFYVVRFSNREIDEINYPEEMKKIIQSINCEYKPTFWEKIRLRFMR